MISNRQLTDAIINLAMIRLRAAARFLAAYLIVAALAAPMAGPLLDHHFAERQPGHLHLGAAGYHIHSHGYEHAHLHTHFQPSAGGYPVAIYKSEGSPAMIGAASADMETGSRWRYEPSSVFTLPVPYEKTARQVSVPPPDKPPRRLS